MTWASPSTGSRATTTGRRTVTAAPSPGVLSMLMRPVVQLGQGADQRQAQAGALRPLLGAAGLFEGAAQAGQVLGRDADAGVGHDQLQVGARMRAQGLDADGHGAAGGRELHGVGHQVQRDLLQGAAVGVDGQGLGRQDGGQIDALVVGLDPHQRHGGRDHLADVEALDAQLDSARPRCG